jgi:hypothetical protein
MYVEMLKRSNEDISTSCEHHGSGTLQTSVRNPSEEHDALYAPGTLRVALSGGLHICVPAA